MNNDETEPLFFIGLLKVKHILCNFGKNIQMHNMISPFLFWGINGNDDSMAKQTEGPKMKIHGDFMTF